MLKKFLCLLLLCFNIACADFEVDFWDVGQGNGTIVNCPGGYPLLVDAGSRQGRKKTDIIKEISQRLKNLLPAQRLPNTPDLFIFVSHGDADHMDCITGIVAAL